MNAENERRRGGDTMHPDLCKILYDEEQIARRVRELGAQIT